MEPTLRAGDRVLIRYGASPQPGRLVVVRLPARPVSVKRAVRREPGGWWVAADNATRGVDSREVGVIPDADVIACVVCRAWPLSRRRRTFAGRRR